MPAAEFVSRSAPSRARLRAHNSDAREDERVQFISTQQHHICREEGNGDISNGSTGRIYYFVLSIKCCFM